MQSISTDTQTYKHSKNVDKKHAYTQIQTNKTNQTYTHPEYTNTQTFKYTHNHTIRTHTLSIQQQHTNTYKNSDTEK